MFVWFTVMLSSLLAQSNVTFEKQQSVQDSQTQWLKHNKIRAFYNSILSTNLHSGSLALYQMAGLGKLKPNTVLLGFKNNWKQASVGEVEEYMRIIQDAFEYNMGVCIFRLRAGFDTTEKSGQLTQGEISHLTLTPRPSVDVPTHKMSLSMESQPLLGRVEEDAPVILNRRVSSTSQPHASVYVDLEMSTYHKTSAGEQPFQYLLLALECTQYLIRFSFYEVTLADLRFSDFLTKFKITKNEKNH